MQEIHPNVDRTLAELMERRKQLDARISKRETEQKAKLRKLRTRYMIVFAGAILADLERHPEIGAALEQSLQRGITAGRDRELLRSFGWRL